MLFVFFFKQKTAYEMRISDWSSDVCSSDLGTRMLAHVPMPSDHHAEGLKDAVRLDEADGSDDRRDADHDIAEQSRHAEQEGGDTPDEAERAFEIGRASCRARVCQYV